MSARSTGELDESSFHLRQAAPFRPVHHFAANAVIRDHFAFSWEITAMTPAVASPLPGHVSALSTRAGATESSGAHARTKNFDSQLDAARQQHKPGQGAQRPNHDGASTTARHDAGAPSSGKSQALADKSRATATATAPDPSSELAAAPPTPRLTAAATTDEKTETTAPGKDDATATAAASSLVGAMLAMLPTAAAILQPGSGGAGVVEGRISAQAITMAGDDANTPQSALEDANGAMPVVAAKDLLVGNGASSALVPGVLAALDSGRDPARAQQGIAALLAPATATSSATLMLPVQAPVGSPAFGPELGQQVAWLSSQAGQGLKQASIRLHPEELGQLDIKVSVKHDRVDVVFSAQHPGAVTAVQQTLPQLSHLLAQHGLSLGHTEVGQQQHNDAPKDSRDSARSLAGVANNDDVHASGVQMTVSRIGLLDAFA
jgi:flagellar hook-length control protein FliK